MRLGEMASRGHLRRLLDQAIAEAKNTNLDFRASDPTTHMELEITNSSSDQRYRKLRDATFSEKKWKLAVFMKRSGGIAFKVVA